MNIHSGIARACAALTTTLLITGAQAATVDWRQGSGNTGQHFTVGTGAVGFEGGAGSLTVGLRAVQRNIGTITPTGNTYAVSAGSSDQANRAWWNFDIYAGLSDVTGAASLAGLSELTLVITSIGGSAPGQSSFDLLAANLRGLIDCHLTGCVNGSSVNPDATVPDLVAGSNDGPLSATANAARFYNASQNPVFAPWFTAFDMNLSAIYDFTLTARDRQGNVVSSQMLVNVGNFVPEPGSLALVGLGLLGAFAVARRRQA